RPGSKPPRYICPSATAHAGIVYAINGAYGPVTAVKAGGNGDVTGTNRQLWTLKKATNVPSPVYHAGYLYWTSEGGLACCANAKDGKMVYQERLKPAAGRAYASPMVVDG